MNLTTCSNRLVSGLVEMLTWAARTGHLDEADRLLAALHLMRPKFVELHAYDAWLLIRRNRMTDAAQLLRQLEGRELQVPFGPYVTALLAVCLSALGDPGWRVYANEVLTRDEDAESVGLMNLLTGKRKKDEAEDTQASNLSAGTADLLRQAMSFSYLRA
ncbi:HrpB1 family type III secretion system apparatus protein [Paraburkholderia phenazinium]|jgi:type III secretion protein HrpB1|uniref:Type III secretion protein HrpB1 n=1 Tax=Paraburkholderia phenazinium TaxID=60549 RepID=A0A1G8K8L7_9BURK|nr:HrpB1 family type III secretion system apparatus protein [Paraburkholderia phenazinium]SDI39795.1 type III secretion protein HrpB1 [Paraburkholderia phenazinium]